MSAPRIVTPEEAQQILNDRRLVIPSLHALLSTVAAEPERTRAAVVKALDAWLDDDSPVSLRQWRDAIENGADF